MEPDLSTMSLPDGSTPRRRAQPPRLPPAPSPHDGLLLAAGYSLQWPRAPPRSLDRLNILRASGIDPCPIEPARTGQRGRPANGASRSLLVRLQQREDEVLHFATDFAVPFDSNQAERDLRMVKVQQKVSGCFRSTKDADHFCRIRGYICTLRKQGGRILMALRSVFPGDPIYPCLNST